MIIYEELVRDKIPDIMIDKGFEPETRILNDLEFIKELDKKILEELLAYLEDDDIEKLIDVYDLMFTILEARGIDYNEFHMARIDNIKKKGDYKKRVYLISDNKKRY